MKEAHRPGTILSAKSNTIHGIYVGLSDNKQRYLVYNFKNKRIESYFDLSFFWKVAWET